MERKRYSSAHLEKKVRDEICFHPITLFACLISFLGLFAFFLFKLMILYYVIVFGIILAAGSLIINLFFRKDVFERDQVVKLQEEIENANKEKMNDLKKGLYKCLEITNEDDCAKQALIQFVQIQEKFTLFNEILLKKFSPTEVTYGRFYSTAEQVYFVVLDNLDKFILNIETTDSFDLDYLEERYDSLEKKIKENVAEPSEEREFENVQKRIDLREDLLCEIKELLSQNEHALTQMDETSVKLSRIQTKRGRANDSQFEDTIKNLQDLADRAKNFNRN